MNDFKVPTLPSTNLKVESNATETCDVKIIQAASPAQEEQVQEMPMTASSCNYKIPEWSAAPPPELGYRFEVLKSGQIIDEVKDLQKQAIWTFGRLPVNDIEMAHPTISRFHAVLQYRPKVQKTDAAAIDNDKKNNDNMETAQPPEGWYIYDLDSTHGTFLNKQRIPSWIYIRVRVGHMLRLGASTRSYILQGPAEDEEPESELSVTELREQRQQQEAAAAAEAQRKSKETEERERNEGISWGMADDADEETDLSHNPYASTNNEELFLDDPKRTLRGYYEREGIPLEYKCEEMSVGSFVCRVELPLDDERGRPLIAEVVHKGRKKECVAQCALEACRILDRHGVLRQANQEPLKRKQKSKGSDSDDDDFWDRTGDIERKKKRKSNMDGSVALTYEDLLKKETELVLQLKQVEEDIIKYQETEKRLKAIRVTQEQLEGDELDNYIENLSDDVTKLDKTEIRKLRIEQQRIKAEQQKLQRLIKIAKPVDLPFTLAFNALVNAENRAKAESVKRQLPMVGKRNQFSKFKMIKLPTTATLTSQGPPSKAFASDEEEVEDEQLQAKLQNEHMARETELRKHIPETTTTTETDKEPKSNKHVTVEKSERQHGPVEIPKEMFDDKIEKDSSTTMTLDPAKKSDAQKDAAVKFHEQYDPAAIPKVILDSNVEKESPAVVKSDAQMEIAVESKIRPPVHNQEQDAEQNEHNTKKRRPRQRQRNKRHEVDIEELDEHESSDKYAKWVPPENQSGDGYTKLNEKYGY